MAITKKPTDPARPGSADAFIEGAPDAGHHAGVRRGRRRQITLTIPPELLARVDARAAELGLSRAAFITQATARALEGD